MTTDRIPPEHRLEVTDYEAELDRQARRIAELELDLAMARRRLELAAAAPAAQQGTETFPIMLEAGRTLHLIAPGGRRVYLWPHHCDDCSSLDVWTTRGRELEQLSADTGDTTRAPVGLFAMANGRRATLAAEGAAGAWPADPSSRGWPAASTVALIWQDGADQ